MTAGIRFRLVEDNIADIRSAYDIHADRYLVKPVDLGQSFAVIAALKDVRFSAATLPAE